MIGKDMGHQVRAAQHARDAKDSALGRGEARAKKSPVKALEVGVVHAVIEGGEGVKNEVETSRWLHQA